MVSTPGKWMRLRESTRGALLRVRHDRGGRAGPSEPPIRHWAIGCSRRKVFSCSR